MLNLAVDNTTPATAGADRRAMLAKVHVAKKQLGMADDDYRALLTRVTGSASAKDCDARQLDRVLGEMGRLGFAGHGARARRAPAGGAVARKARALWISLAQLGAIEVASEAGLETFARRQLGSERLAWMNEREGYRLIEALKAMAQRHGWDQSLPARMALPDRVRLLKDRLVGAQLARLAAAGIQVAAPLAADRAGWSDRRLERAASELAALIRSIPKPA